MTTTDPTNSIPAWSYDDQDAAHAEGWDIFSTDGRDLETEQEIVEGQPYGHRPFELQALDEDRILRSDEAAWRLVGDRANTGSALHQRAMHFLRYHSPREFDAIMAWLAAHPV